MILGIILLLGLLAFINWGMVKLGADFDDINEKIYREIKVREKHEVSNGVGENSKCTNEVVKSQERF